MPSTVKPTIQRFGTSISLKEVKKLETEVGQVPDRDELTDLKAARKENLDKFSPVSLREYDRFVGQFRVSGGQVEQYYLPFHKQWKVDESASYRQRWGVKNVDDKGAPTFERRVAPSIVPAGIRATFDGFTEKKRGELKDKGTWPNHDPSKPEVGTTALTIYDRDHRIVGYALRVKYSDGKWLESQYRKDGTPVYWETSDRPND